MLLHTVGFFLWLISPSDPGSAGSQWSVLTEQQPSSSNHVSCCHCKINNTYILLFQNLDFRYLRQILYSTVVNILTSIKLWRWNDFVHILCVTVTQIKLFLLELNLSLNMSGIKVVSEACIHSMQWEQEREGSGYFPRCKTNDAIRLCSLPQGHWSFFPFKSLPTCFDLP